MLKIDLRKTDFHPNGDLGHDTRQIEVKDSFDFDELPNLLFDYYVTCNFNDKPQLASSECYGFFEQICRFFEGRKRQVVQTIWQAYDGAANVVMNFYYKAD